MMCRSLTKCSKGTQIPSFRPVFSVASLSKTIEAVLDDGWRPVAAEFDSNRRPLFRR